MSRGLTHESATGATVEWYTPPWVFEALGLAFDLDPCHPEGDRLPWVPAAKVYTKADDGLAQPWEGRVWMNPPYGDPENACPRKCKKKACVKRGYHLTEAFPGSIAWLAKMHEHRHGLALVFARTGPEWFQKYVTQADAVFFFNRRIKFVDRSGEPPVKENGSKADRTGADSMLVAWGPDCVAALYRLERAGLGYVYGRHRNRWEATILPPSRLRAFHWIPFLPELALEFLLDIAFQWRNYFGQGPGADTETQAWAAELHRRLRTEKEARRRKDPRQ